jgi:hypothetical protein
MAYEMKESYGSIFKNSKKENEKQPDYKGEIMFNGEVLDLAGWVKKGENGTFLSLKIGSKHVKTETQESGFFGGSKGDSPF